MREIKFRGKSKDTNKWVFGYLFEDEFKSWILKEIVKESFNGEVTEYDNDVDWIEVDKETVGQFTGFEDIKYKEIYVGDLLSGAKKTIWEVVWCEKKRQYFRKAPSAKGHMTLSDSSIITNGSEIIGDIHENPKLLNK